MAAYIQAVLCLSYRSSWRYMIGQAGRVHILSLSGKHDSGPRDRRLVPNIPQETELKDAWGVRAEKGKSVLS